MPCQHFGHTKWVANKVSQQGHEYLMRIDVGNGSGYVRLKRVAMESCYLCRVSVDSGQEKKRRKKL